MKISTPEEEKSRTRTCTIIMADDEPDANVTIKTALEGNGDFQVDTFSDAVSALFAFKPGHYDLAILDIKMPGMNGFQLCKRLREIDKGLKISFLTATELTYFQDIDSVVINDLRTDCFITKPVNTTDLIDAVNPGIWQICTESAIHIFSKHFLDACFLYFILQLKTSYFRGTVRSITNMTFSTNMPSPVKKIG
jgi:CheY-like chemotaxis protein